MDTVVRPDEINPADMKRLASELTSVAGLVATDGTHIDLPPALTSILHRAATELSAGNGVTVLPLTTVLTTAEVAEMLGVSRPHVVKLVDTGKLDHHMVGTHRRVVLTDMLEYRATQDQVRRDALAEMHRIADDTGMDL